MGMETSLTVHKEEPGLAAIVAEDLRQGDLLSLRLPGYEERPAQIEMAAVVAEALTGKHHAVIEAATGTGKSLSYLLPLVRSGKTAIISTANKALQEQLFYKDIPFVQRHITPFDAALVKGMGNYLCLDRLEEERSGMQYYVQNPEFERLVEETNVAAGAFNGDFETLNFTLPGDIRAKVCGDSDRCAWRKCHYFLDCYIRQMKETAKKAQIIVVNHTLLLLDAFSEGNILPKRDVIIVDESQHLEEEATQVFTVSVRAAQVFSLLAQKALRAAAPSDLLEDIERLAILVWQQLEQDMPENSAKRAPFHRAVEDALHLASLIEKLAAVLQTFQPLFQTESQEILYKKLIQRAKNLAEHMRTVFAASAPQDYVYYLERVSSHGKDGFAVEASAAPLQVAPFLKQFLFDQGPVICTSATLATIGPHLTRPEVKGPNFGYFCRRVGLWPTESMAVLERILPLTFDYKSHALLYVPRDVPEPAYGTGQAAQDYTMAVARKMYSLVKASRGRAFLLFSSRRMLDQAYTLMSPHLDYPLLRQGDMTRIELTRRFRAEPGAVLFGLKSFWEGVDIAGDALSLVVIDKLPFDPPDDPVHEARVAQMKAAGENWFGIYVLPQTVLRLKQGLGRLLRTREDRGVMAILDTRLYSKGYGKEIFRALPPSPIVTSVKEVERFFANG